MCLCIICSLVATVLITLLFLGAAYYVYALMLPLANAGQEMIACMHNETVSLMEDFKESTDPALAGPLGKCKDLQDQCGGQSVDPLEQWIVGGSVPNAVSVGEEDEEGEEGDESPECKELKEECQCGFLKYIYSLQDPPVEDRMTACCAAFTGDAASGKDACLQGVSAIAEGTEKEMEKCPHEAANVMLTAVNGGDSLANFLQSLPQPVSQDAIAVGAFGAIAVSFAITLMLVRWMRRRISGPRLSESLMSEVQ